MACAIYVHSKNKNQLNFLFFRIKQLTFISADCERCVSSIDPVVLFKLLAVIVADGGRFAEIGLCLFISF
jgi:hypothetical protein